MENQFMLPIGIEDFKEIREECYYYVDKTALIEQVLEKRSKVTLFTRPRRFGKSLNMSMLKRFFEIGTDPSLFEGLHISKNAALCERYMGKYPVIAISLKGGCSILSRGSCPTRRDYKSECSELSIFAE